jgi:hypothetical protein
MPRNVPRAQAAPQSEHERARQVAVNVTEWLFRIAYVLVAILFGLCALALIAFAAIEVFQAIDLGADSQIKRRLESILEGIGLLTIAVASLELSQTVLEEEVRRDALMSGPTRARRFLSRFMLVIVVALAVEFLVAVFELAHSDPEKLSDAVWIGVGAALLLAAWGFFIRMNKSAEELEPEAMAEAKQEDRKLK